MKYLISEDQYKILIEQPESRFGLERYGYNPNKPETLEPASQKQTEFLQSLNPHTVLTIFQIGTAFIPLVGPFISAGIGMADAAIYLKEGQKSAAGIIAIFSLIPFSGKLISKLGLGKWTRENLAKLGEKIFLKKPLSPVEIEAANRIANNASMVEKEVMKLAESKGVQTTAKSTIKQNLLKQGIEALGLDKLPKKFFHGSPAKINLSNLSTLNIGKTVGQGWKTGSSDLNGMYFSENLWDNFSHVNQYTNPVYKAGAKSIGSESAEKYAQLAIKGGKKGYIYEMTLAPDAVVVSENSLRINVAGITADNEKKLLSMGIDAIYRQGQELVVLNKNAIKSFDLKYVGDKFLGNKIKNYFGDLVPTKGSFGFNWKPM